MSEWVCTDSKCKRGCGFVHDTKIRQAKLQALEEVLDELDGGEPAFMTIERAIKRIKEEK